MKRRAGLKAGGEPAKITVAIRPGSASAAATANWRKFWQKLIAEVRAGER